jgi:hypothetical protein
VTVPSVMEQRLSRFDCLFLDFGTVWLELDEVVVAVIELKMRAKRVQESDEELVSIVLLVVSKVA